MGGHTSYKYLRDGTFRFFGMFPPSEPVFETGRENTFCERENTFCERENTKVFVHQDYIDFSENVKNQ